MSAPKVRPFDASRYLDTRRVRAEYLQATWEDSGGDVSALVAAIGDVARSIGMTQIARDLGVAREALYRSLSEKGNPEFGTVMKVLERIGVRVAIEPVAPPIRRARAAKPPTPSPAYGTRALRSRRPASVK